MYIMNQAPYPICSCNINNMNICIPGKSSSLPLP
jgi:hypothetical protein